MNQKDIEEISNKNYKTSNIGKNLGTFLLEKEVITKDQLEVAKKQLKIIGGNSLGNMLVSLGSITEEALGESIANMSGIKKLDQTKTELDVRLIKKIPKHIAIEHNMIAVFIRKKRVMIAINDIYNVIALDIVKKYFPANLVIEPIYAPKAEIIEIISQYYEYEMSVDGILKEIEDNKEGITKELENGQNYKNPIIRLVDSFLIDAVRKKASDIHFEPEKKFLRVRYRLDGRLRQEKEFHIDYWSAVLVRLKIMASMNIAESRNSQDGHATSVVLGREIDFRVATQPTINGENVVMRILDKSNSLRSLDKLGYNQNNIKLLKKMLKKPEGVIIFTGPTGSGKTTSLYSVLSYINSIEKNIMTLEDPVEYELPLIRQTSIQKGSVSFASAIKSVLRQDPDIIFVGEIRDVESASITMRAAMTGHQVFTTLHTNNAISAIARLVDIGVEPFLIASSLIGCVAQRLIRVLCLNCKKAKIANSTECKILGIKKDSNFTIYEKTGCLECSHTGFKGRESVVEIIMISNEINKLISASASTSSIIEQAKKEGMKLMDNDVVNKIKAGITSLGEAIDTIDMTNRF